MKYLRKFRSRKDAEILIDKIRMLPLDNERITLMEVCGSHTMAIHKYGIREVVPRQINLISGPGCPVCVTGMAYIDQAVTLAGLEGVIVATFGDMMNVPGSSTTLMNARTSGRDIRVVYSTLDALDLARNNKERQVVFLGIGFETTAPTIAASVLQARKEKLANYSVLVSHKLMPPAMRALASDPAVGVHGYICPAHVSAVIGSQAYEFLAREFGVACVVAGFEPLDILQGIYLLLRQILSGKPRVDNEYSRVVKTEGNRVARKTMEKIFEPCEGHWRGIGTIPGSGLTFRPQWAEFDAAKRFPVQVSLVSEPSGCICGDILKGIKIPSDCSLFGEKCSPEHPVGACMVSSEGTCAAWFKYGKNF